jgi:hypothetical protein
MAVRTSMAALISRVRLLINDTGGSPTWQDQDIQDILDASRIQYANVALAPRPTFTGATIQYLDYYSDLGDWEDDLVLKQFLVNVVTPSSSENIVGHWVFAATTLPPVYITGKTYDIYRAAADILERWAAKVVMAYDINVDGQSLHRSQMATMLTNLAHQYRMKQRAHVINVTRTDVVTKPKHGLSLEPQEIDYMGSGDGR